MKIAYTFISSYKSLMSDKMRSFLTMLGIIIGISSVIIVLSVGASAQNLILDQVKSIGSNLLVIFPGESDDNGPPVSVLGISITTLTVQDVEAIQDPNIIAGVSAGTGYVRGVGSFVYEGENRQETFLGVSEQYLQVEDAVLQDGRFFSKEDNLNLSNVVVLGHTLKNDLFRDANPIGKRIKIKNEPFIVIGFMKERGSSGFDSPDSYAFVPIKTAQKKLVGINHISFARIKVANENDIDYISTQVRALLRDRHDLREGESDDFTIRTAAQALSMLTTITNAIKFFLSAVAAVSLLVGGIGIMNIMFVAITERTQEIGLRKALGAKGTDIITQFVVESMFISFIGGVIGLLSGIIISYLISLGVQAFGYEWNFILKMSSVLLAIFFAISVGLFFGLYPAYKASKLNPIEALRYE